ncbi:type III secretion system outer membrane ring subunit SctC [Paraburkholderia sediminicola]|uniref:type III secretion system outer membrane ring subunit SctC n=1 Tax=Paraburkholderia sediminicola TaxID=458836 RepID=UPI0038B8203E
MSTVCKSARACALLAFAATCLGAVAAESSIDTLKDHGFFVVARSMPVRAILQDFGASYGVPVIISDGVKGVFTGQIRENSEGKVLEQFASKLGLAWYMSGGVIYIGKVQEMRESVITPTWLSASQLLASLRTAHLFSNSYCTANLMGNLNALNVTGVPQCIDRVNELARSLDNSAKKSERSDETVEIFPLRYASAIDSSYMYRNQQVTVPGVVTELREMSASRALPNPVSANSATPLPPLPPSSDLDKQSRTQKTSIQPLDDKAVVLPPLPALPTVALEDQRQPSFSADVRQNAVIVRDRATNMDLYRRLISLLDKRPVQIEVSVDIIDVDAGNFATLGVDISGSATLGGSGISLNGTNFNASTFSALLSNSVDFLIRINALEQSAKARILSRPSVVTLNNEQAILDRNVTFYAKLQGKDIAKLESVAAGSLLRVTPRLVSDGGLEEIVLTLDIQDGQQSERKEVDSLPQIQNSSITTQAILKPGQSLLLGGFVQNQDVSGQRRIPFLSDIPLLGGLFTSRSKGEQSVVRLFLISARPLDFPGAAMDTNSHVESDFDSAR